MSSKKYLERIVIVLASFFFASFSIFILFEMFPAAPTKLGLHLVHYYALKDRYVLDPDLIFRLKPFFHYKVPFAGDHQGFFSKSQTGLYYESQFDEEGFRNQGKEKLMDVVVLGDSFIQFGLTESDTMPSRLEKITGLRIANYGSEWYGPYQYLITFKKYALKRKPSKALFCIFEGNDFRDLQQYLKWKSGGSYYHFNLTSKNLMQRYFIMLKDTAEFFIKKLSRNIDPRNVSVRIKDKHFHTVLSYPVDTRKPEKIVASPEGQALVSILAEFKNVCLQNGIAPVVVFIPSDTHLYLPYIEKKMRPEWLENKANIEMAVEKIVSYLSLPWLNLRPFFDEALQEGRVIYYPFDTHWNSEGRQLAAEKIAELVFNT